jgi:phosphatidate cytidylyltransferase
VIILDSHPVTIALMSLAAGLCALEASGLIAPGGGFLPGLIALFMTGVAAALVAAGTSCHMVAPLLPGAVLSVYWMIRDGVTEARVRLAGSLGVLALLSLGFGLLARHALYAPDPLLIGIPLLICWVGDSAAYFAGSSVGRHRLLPAVSPGKTWEGLAAGLAGAIAGAAAAGFLVLHLPLWQMIVTGAAGGAAAVAGDLFESALKRDAGVKDSGALLPGHGGFLDRFDSLVAVAPVTWILLTVFGHLGGP